MIDIKKNIYLILGKDKEFLLDHLCSKGIIFDKFPDDQKKDGFNIISVDNFLFWFDLDDILYAIDINYLNATSNKYFNISYNNIEINTEGYSDSILLFLKENGVIHGNKELFDEDLGFYYTVSYIVNNEIIYILNINDKNTIFGALIQYDGYHQYYYKQGISLRRYLDRVKHST